MKVSASLKDQLVPKFNGNRELEPSEQITIEIKRPSLSEQTVLKTVKMTQAGDFSFGYNVDRILRNHVGKITNLESEVNGNTVVINDGRTLALNSNPALEPLVTEICLAVTGGDTLSEGEVKN